MAAHRESIVVHIACDPPAILWSGVGFLPLAPDAVIDEPSLALGGGELVSFPDFQQLLGGTAERLEAVFSGVSEETIRLAIADAPSVRNAIVTVGTVRFSTADWSIVAVDWEATFQARSLKVGRPQAQNGSVVRSITLAIVQGETRRFRAPNAYFTDADQRRRSATDSVFSHVGAISVGVSRRWGPV